MCDKFFAVIVLFTYYPIYIFMLIVWADGHCICVNALFSMFIMKVEDAFNDFVVGKNIIVAIEDIDIRNFTNSLTQDLFVIG